MMAGMPARDALSAASHCPDMPVPGQRHDASFESDLAQRIDRAARRAGDRACAVRELLSAVRGRRVFLRPHPAAAALAAFFHRLQCGRLLRLQSDHDEMAFHLVAGRAEYSACRHGADAGASGAGLHFCGTKCSHGTFFCRQDRHRPVLVPRGVLPERVALCLPLFPLHEGAPPCPDRWRVAGAAGRPCRRRRDPAARDRKRRRQAAVAGRRAVAVDGRSRPVDPQHPGAGRHRRRRGCDPRFRPARKADHARGDDALGVRAGGAPRGRADAGAQARADRQPAAVAGKRGQPAADRRRGRGPVAALQRQHRLCAPRSPGEATRRSSSPAAAVRSARKSATASRPSAPHGCW